MKEPWAFFDSSRIYRGGNLAFSYRPQDIRRWTEGILWASQRYATLWALDEQSLPRLADGLDALSHPWQGHLHGQKLGSIVLRWSQKTCVIRRTSSLLGPMAEHTKSPEDAEGRLRLLKALWETYHDHLLDPDKPRWAATLPGMARIATWARVDRVPWLSFRDARLVRRAYYGGRVEVFRLRADSAWYADRNAAYVQHYGDQFPIGEPTIVGQTEAQAAFTLQTPGLYLAEIMVPDDAPFGPVPYRGRMGSGYPVGPVGGWFWLEDLQCALDSGADVTPYSAALWRQWGPYMRAVQDWAYSLRNDMARLGPEWGAWAKAVTVALAGSLAPRPERSRIHRLRPGEVPRACTCGQIPCRCQAWMPLDRQARYWIVPSLRPGNRPMAPHWAGLINARARRVLWQAMRSVDPESLVYVDTDCIIATERPVVDQDTWKEYHISDWRCVGPKMYQYRRDDTGEQVGIPISDDGTLETQVTRVYGVQAAWDIRGRWEHSKDVKVSINPQGKVTVAGRRLDGEQTRPISSSEIDRNSR